MIPLKAIANLMIVKTENKKALTLLLYFALIAVCMLSRFINL